MLDYNIVSGSELGRAFAPKDIKDREGWGRKLKRVAEKAGLGVKEHLRSLGLIPAARTQYEVHTDALMRLGPANPHQYKAPHANRGTPPRPHYSRYTRAKRAF